MDLNLFKDIKNNTNNFIKNFIDELSDFLTNKKNEISKAKEGHLYLVTEDRNGKVFLWDLTDKPKNEFEETNFPQNLLSLATEGTVFQYKNGTYEFYSSDGFDMLYGE